MILTCPACTTRYEVRAASIKPGGRTVRCTSCGHRWHVDPPEADAGARPDDPAASRTAPVESTPPAVPAPVDEIGAAEALRDDDDTSADTSDDTSDADDEPEPHDDDDARFEDADAPDEPEPRPSGFDGPVPAGIDTQDEETRPDRRSSVLAITGWLLVAVAVLALAGLVVARNAVVEAFPQTLPTYRALGLPIALDVGLKIGVIEEPEAVVEEGTPVMIVRGVIDNVSGRERPVPDIRIGLLDDRGVEIDHDYAAPAAATLAAGATTRFELRYPRPPANLREMTVEFDLGDAPAPGEAAPSPDGGDPAETAH
ncbi:MAG: zinc-ribbon domain-containing protein [Geminicoccaceae bacterium]|nr:zinc-ribbon domain-containing protein [Geminicoccaceae bacterium]